MALHTRDNNLEIWSMERGYYLISTTLNYLLSYNRPTIHQLKQIHCCYSSTGPTQTPWLSNTLKFAFLLILEHLQLPNSKGLVNPSSTWSFGRHDMLNIMKLSHNPIGPFTNKVIINLYMFSTCMKYGISRQILNSNAVTLQLPSVLNISRFCLACSVVGACRNRQISVLVKVK